MTPKYNAASGIIAGELLTIEPATTLTTDWWRAPLGSVHLKVLCNQRRRLLFTYPLFTQTLAPLELAIILVCSYTGLQQNARKACACMVSSIYKLSLSYDFSKITHRSEKKITKQRAPMQWRKNIRFIECLLSITLIELILGIEWKFFDTKYGIEMPATLLVFLWTWSWEETLITK
jgi:hypothetical protein